LLSNAAPLEQFSQCPEAERAVREGDATNFVEGVARIRLGQREETLQHPNSLDSSGLQHGFGPGQGLFADPPNLAEQPGRTPFHATDFLFGEVFGVGAEAALFVPHVHGDLLPALIEDADDPRIPAGPDGPSQMLRWHRVIGLGYFHMPIAAYFTLGFVKERKAFPRHRLQGGSLDFVEDSAHLSFGRAVDPRVGNGAFPLGQKTVLFFQRHEGPRLEGIVLHVLHARLNLALVPRRVRLRRQDHRVVMLGE